MSWIQNFKYIYLKTCGLKFHLKLEDKKVYLEFESICFKKQSFNYRILKEFIACEKC